MENISIRTDLAVEAREMVQEETKKEVPGVAVNVEQQGDIKITRVKIEKEVGQKIMGKPIGNYITLEIPQIREKGEKFKEDLAQELAKELNTMVHKKVNKDATTLVVGLGNWNITPDSLGPKVISKLMVTRHLLENIPDMVDQELTPVCAISPGVLGITGIETSEIVKGIVEKIKPNLVIAIDALASRRAERVNTTIQMTDSGINPGSGVGNKRKALNKDSLGIPVIAIGIPTVVDATTLANDTIDLMLDAMIKEATQGKEFYNMLKEINREEKHMLIRQILHPYVGDLMVTPKEVDLIIDDISLVVANGINIALHPGIGLEDVNRYIN
ncbi:GPR endopeptidase [Garciella nitratireducens]|uniref:Germination protease n=1 Tax=Garciella nitratireducens DSM 15102 TaxID=1121911 RepID=A0A1T4PYB4_9FIRM|nr:GPR endopeptidase [Garciella nitratireducens]RBP45480.1 spore protease [Garciella nitratireducens]SJZ96241.1 spore protease [Garciella nitratireducens DSM 15102]